MGPAGSRWSGSPELQLPSGIDLASVQKIASAIESLQQGVLPGESVPHLPKELDSEAHDSHQIAVGRRGVLADVLKAGPLAPRLHDDANLEIG